MSRLKLFYMRKLYLMLLGVLCLAHARAQDTLGTDHQTVLSGDADVYYKYNFNQNASDNKTSFTNSQNSFELGMVSLKLQHTMGKVSFTGDLGFGKRAEEFSYNDQSSSVAVKQLYMSYSPYSWLRLTAGSFATYIGYELVDANLNRNYSMSYMFSYGPFFHTGVKAEFTAGSSVFMVGVFNPNDFKYAPLNSKKYLGAQWAFTPKSVPFSSYLNLLGGTDTSGVRHNQADLVMNYKFSRSFSLGFDGTYVHSKFQGTAQHWWGSALYANLDFSSVFGLTWRTEYFDDQQQLIFPTASGGNIWSNTLSADIRLAALTLIPEFRLDHASQGIFTAASGNSSASTANVLMAAIYTF